MFGKKTYWGVDMADLFTCQTVVEDSKEETPFSCKGEILKQQEAIIQNSSHVYFPCYIPYLLTSVFSFPTVIKEEAFAATRDNANKIVEELFDDSCDVVIAQAIPRTRARPIAKLGYKSEKKITSQQIVVLNTYSTEPFHHVTISTFYKSLLCHNRMFQS